MNECATIDCIVTLVTASVSDFVDFFFVFKQKTAYALRISDWSSEVCSSDLAMVSQFHPKMLAALFLPFIIALLGAIILLWSFWTPLTGWLNMQVRKSDV